MEALKADLEEEEQALESIPEASASEDDEAADANGHAPSSGEHQASDSEASAASEQNGSPPVATCTLTALACCALCLLVCLFK